MRLSARSYPHPVVGNRDDVPGASFQAVVEMTSDKENVYLDVSVACSSATLNELIERHVASFVVHVECSNTLFRRAYDFHDSQHRVSIPAENLNDAVEVNVFVRAARDIHDYRVDKAHAEYGDVAFEIRKDDVLAVGEGQVFFIDTSYDSLSRVGSIMQIQEASEEGDLPMRTEWAGDKITVILAKKDFADYKLLKSDDAIAAPLTTTIVLPVLIEALHILREEPEDENEDRWLRVLRRRIEALGVSNETDLLILAQKLLELPIKRALTASRLFVES